MSHTERAHAIFAPSSSSRWLNCPAAVKLSEGVPDQAQSVHTLSGTACHERSEEHLNKWTDPNTDDRPIHMEEDGITVHLLPHEWQEHAVPYVEGIRFIYEELQLMYGEEAATLLIEERVTVSGKDCWGSLDAAMFVPGEELHIADLKAGQNIVDPDSAQFKTYASGMFDKYGPFKTIILHRFQAKDLAQPHATHVMTPEELAEYKATAIKAIKKAKRKGAEKQMVLGAHCKWCPAAAAGKCDKQTEQALAVLDDDQTTDVATLSEDKIAKLLEIEPQVTQFFKDLKAHILSTGNAPTGFKVVEGRSQRCFRKDLDEGEIAEAILDRGGDPWIQKLASMSKIEKALGKGKIDDLLVRPEGKPTLAPESDKRPPMNIGLAALD